MKAACAVACLALALAHPSANVLLAQEARPDLFQSLAELLRSPDRDIRGLALQEIREGLPGPAATARLTALLPTLDPAAQAALLQALGDRGDPAALPAVRQALQSSDLTVRTTALVSIGILGGASDVAQLVQKAAHGPPAEREAAKRGLAHLKGDQVVTALTNLLGHCEPALGVESLQELARRRARTAIPIVLLLAHNADLPLRLAALRTLEILPEPQTLRELVTVLAWASDEQTRTGAQRAINAVARAAPQKAMDIMLAELPNAPPPATIRLLELLSSLGGQKPLNAILQGLAHEDPAVRKSALGLLASWPDTNALPPLLKIATQATNSTEKLIALRGVIRLAGADDPRAVDSALLRQAWNHAPAPAEKRMILAALGNATTSDALRFAAEAINHDQVREEAVLATILIAERLPATQPEIEPAMRRAAAATQQSALKQRASQLLARGSLKPSEEPKGP